MQDVNICLEFSLIRLVYTHKKIIKKTTDMSYLTSVHKNSEECKTNIYMMTLATMKVWRQTMQIVG